MLKTKITDFELNKYYYDINDLFMFNLLEVLFMIFFFGPKRNGLKPTNSTFLAINSQLTDLK